MKFRFKINLFFSILSCIAYLCVFISPASIWFTGFIALGIPFLLLIQFYFIYYWIKHYNFKFLTLPLLTLLLGYNQLNRTLSFDFNTIKISMKEEEKLKVLSGNVRVFNVYKHLHQDNPESSEKYISWLSDNDNSILCLQEFYNEKGNKTFHTSKRFKNNYPYQFINPAIINRIGAEFGVAIFSKYKIQNKGTIEFEKASKNQAIYADILFNESIIRIYNIHLESMHIPENELFDGKNDQKTLKTKSKDTYRRLRKGFSTRAQQIDVIIQEIKSCPYPVIVCGDLNDLPYSYTYQQLKNTLNNSFEEKGLGLGVTYNGKIPFLRIDNQFFSDNLGINSFKIHKKINYSDHFPISAEYFLKEKED